MTTKMTTCERLKAIFNREEVDRLPLIEWAPWWNETVDRWHTEGLPTNLTFKDVTKLQEYFGLDKIMQFWFRAIHWDCPRPNAEEAGHGASIIKDMDDYERLHEHFFVLDDQWPLDPARMAPFVEEQRRGDTAIWFSLDGFFWLPRTLLGDEEHMYSFYDEPELLHRINQENAQWMLKMIDRICEITTPEFMTFAEDMSYNNGPMLSQELFNEFMKPYYEQVIPKLKDKGIRVFIDSDGDVTKCASWFNEAGLEGILPLERQAGVDMATLRKENPDQLYIGGFNKLTMKHGEAAMREEFERLLPVASQGGYVISPDHQTPPEVSLENYKLYVTLFQEYAQRAAL